MKAVSIIRNRGQLTIPDSIRRFVPWVNPVSAVTISVTKPDEILIKPHKTYVDWDKIWAGIKKSRALKGKGESVSAVEFLDQDRKSH